MTNINSKEVLAKLLATENIDIQHNNVNTASFDVKNRVLTLPLWEDMKDFTYDHLVGHEVGHAVWTDSDKWIKEIDENPKNFKGFLNIVEDARIEKLIQRRYPGLKTSFIKSYKKLLADGLFGRDADEINTYKLIDRLNVLFKCGQTVGVKIADDEKHWVDKMSSIETFDQAISLAHELFEKAKAEHQEERQNQEEMRQEMMASNEENYENEFDDDYDEDGNQDFSHDSDDGWGDDEDDEDDEEDSASSDNGDESDDDNADGDTDTSDNDVEEETDAEEKTSVMESEGLGYSNEGGENLSLDPDLPIAESEKALEENLETEFGKTDDVSIRNWKLDLDDKVLSERIISYKDIIKDLSEDMVDGLKAGQMMYKDFQVNNKKTINYLVKEFEMKKKAAEYKRATTSKTGVIDTLKMNNYKFSDDIFKKMTIVPDGKNHGLVMFIDWSGSMANQMSNTVEQLLNLVSFCRQVQIPFQVYAFSDNNDRLFNQDDLAKRKDLSNKNKTCYSSNFHLLQYFDSKMSRTDFQKACAIVLAIGKYWENRYREDFKYGYYRVPRKYFLSGTPLNDTIIAAHSLVKNFQKNHRIDVMNTVFLTDGISHSSKYYSYFPGDVVLGKSDLERGFSVSRKFRHCFINPITKKQYKVNYCGGWSGEGITRTLLKSLADYTNTNVVGFHILPSRKPSAMQEMPGRMTYGAKENMWNDMKKNKFCIIPDNGYTLQFGVLGGDLKTSNGSIEVSEDATKAQIRTAFKKANVGKKESRVMLSKFIDMVA